MRVDEAKLRRGPLGPEAISWKRNIIPGLD